LKASENGKGFIVRVQAPAGKSHTARLSWMGEKLILGPVRGGELASWLLKPTKGGWTSSRVSLREKPQLTPGKQ